MILQIGQADDASCLCVRSEKAIFRRMITMNIELVFFRFSFPPRPIEAETYNLVWMRNVQTGILT